MLWQEQCVIMAKRHGKDMSTLVLNSLLLSLVVWTFLKLKIIVDKKVYGAEDRQSLRLMIRARKHTIQSNDYSNPD